MADTAAVDAAIIARLVGDATLTALMPDGVYRDIAASGKTRVVIVQRMSHEDNYQFSGSSWEVLLYNVEARARDTSGTDVTTAAARIHTLLQDAALSISGYTLMRLHRVIANRRSDVDPENDARWQYGGGVYEAWVAPT